MEPFPWWNEAQKKLAVEAKQVVDEILIPIGERAALKKEFPRVGLQEIAKRGWFGAQIPAKYGGHAEEWGVTGAAIILEEVARAGSIARSLAILGSHFWRCSSVASIRLLMTAPMSSARNGCLKLPGAKVSAQSLLPSPMSAPMQLE